MLLPRRRTLASLVSSDLIFGSGRSAARLCRCGMFISCPVSADCLLIDHRQQLLGGNIIMYYTVYVFSMAGLVSCPRPKRYARQLLTTRQRGNTNLYSSAIQYVIFLVTTGIMLPVIDRVPR